MKIFRIIPVALALCVAIIAGAATPTNLRKITILGKQYYTYMAEKGESLYGIGKLLNWNTGTLATLNPNVKFPLKDDVLLIYPADVTDDSPHADTEMSIVNHKIGLGETLYGLARKYNTRVEDIMRENPGVNDRNFQAGATIKIPCNSRLKNTVKETVKESTLISVNSYKVKKNDTWWKLASRFNIDEQLLRAANPDVNSLIKGMMILIPEVATADVVRQIPVTDPRESSAEGRQEIFEEIAREFEEKAIKSNVRVAVLLEDPSSIKDTEFMRGVIYAIDELKNSPYKITLTAIDGNAGVYAIQSELEKFKPDLILTTAEKDFPVEIAELMSDSGCKIVNVFDTRSTDFLTNKDIVQVYPPADYFNYSIRKFIKERFDGWSLIIVEDEGQTDPLVTEIADCFAPGNMQSVRAEDISEFQVEPGANYLVYGSATKKADIKKLLEETDILSVNNPGGTVAVLGRPSWVTHISSLGEQFGRSGVFIPSRFYFDSDLAASKRFIGNYKELYTHSPVKSFPVYSVTGYDAARFLIPAMNATLGNLNNINSLLNKPEGLQNDFNLEAVPGGGLVNNLIYILKFNPYGNIDKIIVE